MENILSRDTVILIAGRLKSRRLKEKIIKKINNKEIILHLIDRLEQVKNISDIIFCTSTNAQDHKVFEIVEQTGVKCFKVSEKKVMKRFIDAVNYFNLNPRNIVRVTADNCLISFEMLEKGIKHHNLTNADVTTMTNLPIGMASEIINYKYFKKLYAKVEDPNSSEYMTWMLDRPDLCNVERIKDESLNRPHFRLTCDTPEDFKLLEIIFSNLYSFKPIDSLEIIKFLDNNKNISQINKGIEQITYEDVKDEINVNIKN